MRKAFVTLVLAIGLCVVPLAGMAAVPTYNEAWNTTPAIPDYDPDWQTVSTQWDNHWDGKNLKQMITTLDKIQARNPEKVDAYLWLSKVYRLEKKYKLAEENAAKALELESDNALAARLLLNALPHIGGRDYVMSNYPEVVKRFAPMPTGRLVPELTGNARWEAAIALWDQKDDIPKGEEACKQFDALADSMPDNAIALAWACRAHYELGAWYTSIDQHEKKAMPHYEKGMTYGKKAIALDPHMLSVVYWHELCLARSIQYVSVFKQAKQLHPMSRDLFFCERENLIFNSFGPNLSLATMITNGGWVTEKAMGMMGIPLSYAKNGLELGAIFYPDRVYAAYGMADLLAYEGKKDEAIKILEQTVQMDPGANPVIRLENITAINFAQMLLDDLKK